MEDRAGPPATPATPVSRRSKPERVRVTPITGSPPPIPPKEAAHLNKCLHRVRLVAELQSSDEDTEEEVDESPRPRKTGNKGKKSGRVYTAEYKVAKQLPWPHHFVPRVKAGKPPKYHQLTMGQFMYG